MVMLKEPPHKNLNTTSFMDYPAVKKLQALAKHPFDLTKEGNLTPQRLSTFVANACGYRLLYGTERINEEVMHALVELAHEAKVHAKMESMQAGEVLNFIEGGIIYFFEHVTTIGYFANS